MRSFGSTRVLGLSAALAMALIAAAPDVCTAAAAQAAAPASPPQTPKEGFEAASANDEKVRLLLTNMTDATPAADVIKQVNQIVTAFEALVRKYPTSGYADDALWQAASLSDTAYRRFKRPEDRDRASKLYRWLAQEYPTSALSKQANTKLTLLYRANPAESTAPANAGAVTPVALTNPAAPADLATLNNIQRTVLPDSVRVSLELDREVTYHEERLGGPARLFFDLKNVQVTAALKDKVLSFPTDVVGKIRVGRHPDNTVRVVLDFEDVSKYSVFTLYNPFRLVIDAQRSAGRVAAVAPLPAPAPVSSTVASGPSPAEPAPLAKAPAPIEIPKVAISEPTLAPPTPEPPPNIAASPVAATPVPSPAPTAPVAPASNSAGGFSIARQLGLSVSRIVIDPGHGGHDPGTLAKGLNEADLTLDVALRLEKLLQKDPGVEVVLTRRTDVFIPLEERTAIANRHNADLFLSIHANSSKNAEANGIETFYLSFASSPDAEAVAARENSASEREMHQLPDIIKAIALNNKLDESRDLATMVQDALVGSLRKTNKDVRSRGVKKAPFVVLIGAQMPSVLAEISFLTNKQELQLLKTTAYKDRIAKSLYDAVVKYRRSLKGAATLTVERQ